MSQIFALNCGEWWKGAGLAGYIQVSSVKYCDEVLWRKAFHGLAYLSELDIPKESRGRLGNE